MSYPTAFKLAQILQYITQISSNIFLFYLGLFNAFMGFLLFLILSQCFYGDFNALQEVIEARSRLNRNVAPLIVDCITALCLNNNNTSAIIISYNW